MNICQDGNRLMSQVQPHRHTFSSSLDVFSTINFLQKVSAAAELAVMKRAGAYHLYVLYVLPKINSVEMMKLEINSPADEVPLH